MQESGEYFKMKKLMRSLEQKSPHLKYALLRYANRNQAKIGIFWTTKIMCEEFRKFVHILSINKTKPQMKSLH